MYEIDHIFKPALVAMTLVVLWFLEAIYPMFQPKGGRLKHDMSNFALGVMNAVLVGLFLQV